MGHKQQFRKEEPVAQHVAIHAWQALSTSPSLPTSVEMLTNAKGRPLNRKSRIYRLKGVAVEGDSVIAKLAPSDTIEKEHFIYEQVLPLIGIPYLKCYGHVPDNNERAWIFLEEARGTKYDEECPSDHALAAETLAKIHTATSEMNLVTQLPKHDLDRYESCLEKGQYLIQENMGNPALSAHDRKLLGSILNMFEQVEKFWPDLGNALAAMPQCLVHGDFVGKNVYVDKTQTPHSMYLIDWDIAGWGAPAFDVERISPALYRRYCASRWPLIAEEQIEFMAAVGRILRNVGLIQATSSSLCYKWVADAMRDLSTYGQILRDSLSAYRAT